VLIGAGAAGSLYPPAFTYHIVDDEKRGSALGLLTFLGRFAAVIFIPLTALLAEELGWRVTARILALVLVTVRCRCALVLRRRGWDSRVTGARRTDSAAQQPANVARRH
jgi:predicted MFS family arabinose efflux permease